MVYRRVPSASDVLEQYQSWPPFREEPLPRDHRFMLWLTREEWQLCYTLSLAYQFDGQLNLSLPMDECFRAMIFTCGPENGYNWQGLKMDEELQLWARQEKCLEPKNGHWLGMLNAGKSPDLTIHFPDAIAFAEEEPTLENFLAMLKPAWQKVQEDLQQIKTMAKYVEPEAKREAAERIFGIGRKVKEAIH